MNKIEIEELRIQVSAAEDDVITIECEASGKEFQLTANYKGQILHSRNSRVTNTVVGLNAINEEGIRFRNELRAIAMDKLNESKL